MRASTTLGVFMNNQAPKISIQLGSPLFLIFLTLKLCGVIDWSWWWVTAPLWGPFAIIAIVFVVIFGGIATIASVSSLLKMIKNRKKK